MRTSTVGLFLAGLVLAGCNKAEDAISGSAPKGTGRYSGIGTFAAGSLWKEMAEAASPADPATAKLQDDEHVIVVIDSHTGEIRQCGDYSGFCVAMNPWTAQSARIAAPIKLKKHASDLAAEDQAAEQSTNATSSTR